MINRINGIAVFIWGIFLLASASVSAISLKLDEVQTLIEENNWDWVAVENPISRLTDEEYHSMHGLAAPEGFVIISPSSFDASPPESRGQFDWRDMNGVSPVKSQGNCGSCWAFCLVHMLESSVMIYDGYTADLSEQQLVSCNPDGYGCNGGWLDAADYFVNPGMAEESCMPYQASDIPCQAQSCEKIAIADDWGYTGDSVTQIKSALADGPVACAIYASDALSYYSGGCFSNGPASSVNHGVLIVGYDDNDCSGQGAWIVKNSWGTSWGENGFFRIKYGDSNVGYGSTRVYYSPTTAPRLVIADYEIDDSEGGNGNGIIEPSEEITLSVTLGNTGNYQATGIGAVLSCKQPDIDIQDNFATWPNIPDGQQAESLDPHYTFSVPSDFPLGQRIHFELEITCNEGAFTAEIVEFNGNITMLHYNGFEGSTDEGWSHQEFETQDDWQRGTPYGTCQWDPGTAFEGSNIWGNDLGPSGWNGEYKSNVRNILTSPQISANDTDEVHLIFQRWLTIEKGIKDQATIYIDETPIWSNPQNTNLIDTEWTLIDIDISEYVSGSSDFCVKFELQSDAGTEYGGWNIDDFMVIGIPTEDPPTPTPTPTPTSDPDEDLNLQFLQLKNTYFRGEKFAISLQITNEGLDTAGTLYVCLDAYGEYFFYPIWSEEIVPIPIILETDYNEIVSIMEFTIPESIPPCGPFYMYSILTKTDSYDTIALPATAFFTFI